MATACTPPSTPTPTRNGDTSRYDIVVTAHAEEIHVEAAFAPTASPFVFEGGTESFVRNLEYKSNNQNRWMAVATVREVPTASCSQGCRLRYQFLLHEAAKHFDRPDSAIIVAGGGIVAPPTTWLLRPTVAPVGFELHARSADGELFAAGLPHRSGDGSGTVYTSNRSLNLTPLAIFGRWKLRPISIGASRIDLAIAPAPLALDDTATEQWVRDNAVGIAHYFGRYPVPYSLVIVVPSNGDDILAETLGGGGASVIFQIGRDMTAASVRESWVPTHEMVHISSPRLGDEHVWLEEGLATYLEPVVRVRCGKISIDQFWGDLLRDSPQGLPEANDQGLNRTHTWGRTYWGGGLFWLLADVEIRETTHNARSIDTVLRAIADAGGTTVEFWNIDDFLRAADHAAGSPVLSNLYKRMATTPARVDLPALWERLGVKLNGKVPKYSDTAALSLVRKAIVSPPDNAKCSLP